MGVPREGKGYVFIWTAGDVVDPVGRVVAEQDFES